MLTETGDMENKQLNYKFPITNHKKVVSLNLFQDPDRKIEIIRFLFWVPD